MTECPDHAYIPGKTERHPDGAFDHIRNTAKAGMSPSDLAHSTAFQTGLRFLDAGFYWEAHEVLEPVWLALPTDSEERIMTQALIQLANARLKLEMERPKAAARLCGIVRTLLGGTKTDVIMTCGVEDVLSWVDSVEQKCVI